MAGLTDLLGALVQSGMSSQAPTRMGNVFGGGQSGRTGQSGSLNDIIGGLGQMLGGGRTGGSQTGAGGGLGGVLGEALGGVAQNKAALGGLGALAGAIMGGGKKATRGAIGGGALAMLASLAISALQKSGQTPSRSPEEMLGVLERQTPRQQVASEAEAAIIVKAMINAAKADGDIDQREIEKIVGKLSEDGLDEEDKQFFLAEAGKPMDTQALINAAAGRPELAAEIYAASLLAIDVDTQEEIAYLHGLATGLGLSPQVTGHIKHSLGVQGI
jgi:uncharacterized membrane protein YebE (DUF533 family)